MLTKTKMLIIGISGVLITAGFALPSNSEATDGFYQFPPGHRHTIALDIAQPATVDAKAAPPTNELKWIDHTIASGESMAIVFQKVGLSARTLHHLINTDKQTKALANLRPGVTLEFGLDSDGKLQVLKQVKSPTETFFVNRLNDTEFKTETITRPVETQLNFAQAEISSSFWNAGVAAGLTDRQISELAGLFTWDIDFALDIRKGDHFKVLFEERWSEGEYLGRGNILAAEFSNMGQTFKAIRANSGDYYNEKGLAMKKAFLRSPLDFRRVSSDFNPRRLHPVTGKVRAHRGTDYVAPVGTPIWSSGNGVVSESGYNKFNGNYVYIRHNSTYTTKYLHLKKRLVKKGQRVKQGDTIGTLGATGRVTGAHLHYEFLVNGVHKNPRTVKLPQAESLRGNDKSNFIAQAGSHLELMDKMTSWLGDDAMLLTHRR